MALFDKSKLCKANDIMEKINRRRRQILVHSAIYYEFNKNIISDFTFDEWCRDLVNLHAKYQKESKNAVFQDVYKNWTGFSGYDLLKGQAGQWAIRKAEYLLSIYGLL